MDSLALLCNLHADGPATLLRLRREGYESLATLRRLEPALLARTLGWNEPTAARFLREATLLAVRTEGFEPSAEDLEPGEEPEFELESTLVAELDGGDDGSEEQDPEAEELEEQAGAESAEPEGIEALLGAWRALDQVAPPGEPTEFVIPRPAPAAHDRRLEELAELTPALCARLAGQGVRTLREFAEASELELARALGLGFTRIKRLQHQARRTLDQERAPAFVPQPRFEAYTPPPVEPFETAGPFA